MNTRSNNRLRCITVLIAFGILSCNPNFEAKLEDRTGTFSGLFRHGNFSTKIQFDIEQDSVSLHVFFTSLEQNANRIPFQNVEVKGDSINFKLQSDFYTYSFRNKWIDNYSKLQGALSVDTITTLYKLEKQLLDNSNSPESEEISFESNGLTLKGTIWFPDKGGTNALVIVTSSGNSDRSASRAEAILFAQRGFTTFHYDKRGTGSSDGDWQSASMDELVTDDINAIKYFSDKTRIPLTGIGILGSSQGAAKIPKILNELGSLQYGIAVSCPGVSLLESDLNYWKNSNAELLGNNLEDAAKLQRKVYEFIAGEMSRAEVEKAVDIEKSESWFEYIWIPSFDEVQTDRKLLYSPIPYFESTKQPILILQGTEDEIIPTNSNELISDALRKSGNDNFEIVLIEGASHSMNYIGESDFPYWSKIHPDYMKTIEDWLRTMSNKVYAK